MELDHFLVLGVRWEPSGEGEPVPLDQPPPGGASDIDQQQWQQYRAQRSSVYVNDSLTLDFVAATALRPVPVAALGMAVFARIKPLKAKKTPRARPSH